MQYKLIYFENQRKLTEYSIKQNEMSAENSVKPYDWVQNRNMYKHNMATDSVYAVGGGSNMPGHLGVLWQNAHNLNNK